MSGRPVLRRRATRQVTTIIAACAAAWAFAVAVTGGFSFRAAGIRVSSHDLWRPVLLAVIFSAAAVRLHGLDVVTAGLRRWGQAVAQGAMTAVRWLGRAVMSRSLPTLVGLVGVGLLIAQWAKGRPLWLDEQMIAINLRDRSLGGLARPLWLEQSAPYGWLVAQKLMLVFFGTGERALRFVPLVFSVATLVAAWWAGRRWLTALAASVLLVLFSLGTWVTHYAGEVKHYSADVFWGLLLPVLGMFVSDAPDRESHRRRAMLFWLASSVGLWWSNAAMLVTPACAVVVLAAIRPRDGLRGMGGGAAAGLAVWTLSFGLHYLVAIRHTLRSTDLYRYWAIGMPPTGAGAAETLDWLARQSAAIAVKPGGTSLALLLWSLAAIGLLLTRPRLRALALGLVPFSAWALASLRLVPMFERLSLWTVPALYLAVALAADAGVRAVTATRGWRTAARTTVAIALSAGVCWLVIDVARSGWLEYSTARPAGSNHRLDDRTGVAWLVAQRQPGDAILTTELALPAVWWYGRVPLAAELGSALGDGTPILQAAYHHQRDCERPPARQGLQGVSRLLVYFGFRFDDVPDGFDSLLLRTLGGIGRIAELRDFDGVTRVAIVDLDHRVGPPAIEPEGSSSGLPGCVSITPAQSW